MVGVLGPRAVLQQADSRVHACRQPGLVLVGLGWDGCDERKMRRSFQMGKADFAEFVDLSGLGRDLGYQRNGLSGLSQHVLGLSIQKNKKVGPMRHSRAGCYA